MRVVVIAFCLILSAPTFANGDSCDDLLIDECHSAEKQGAPKVQPIPEKAGGQNEASNEKNLRQKTDKETQINLSVGDLERLIKAIQGQQKEANSDRKPNYKECDDPSLSYTDFLSCEDLKAQEEMADGTTNISDLAFKGFWWGTVPGLALLSLSLIAATAAALYSKRTAVAAESAERAYLHITFDAEYDLRKKDGDKERAVIRITPMLHNYGKTPAFLEAVEVNRAEHRQGNHSYTQNDSRKKFFISKDGSIGADKSTPIAYIEYLDIFDLKALDGEEICTVYCDCAYRDIKRKQYIHRTKTDFYITTQHHLLFSEEEDDKGRRPYIGSRTDTWPRQPIIYKTEITRDSAVERYEKVEEALGSHPATW